MFAFLTRGERKAAVLTTCGGHPVGTVKRSERNFRDSFAIWKKSTETEREKVKIEYLGASAVEWRSSKKASVETNRETTTK